MVAGEESSCPVAHRLQGLESVDGRSSRPSGVGEPLFVGFHRFVFLRLSCSSPDTTSINGDTPDTPKRDLRTVAGLGGGVIFAGGPTDCVTGPEAGADPKLPKGLESRESKCGIVRA